MRTIAPTDRSADWSAVAVSCSDTAATRGSTVRGTTPKRGNIYLRTLLIHGARAALPSLSEAETPLGRWLKAMLERGVHRNAVVVALADKLARIAWATLRNGTTFERVYPTAA
nr:hypothetical protein [Sphingomonas gellani]